MKVLVIRKDLQDIPFRKMALLTGVLVVALIARPVAADPILVFAASSLSGALDAVAEDYQKTHPTNIKISYAASSTLARQLAQGAPADIYISANVVWVKYVEDQQAIQAASKFILVRNQLVLAAPGQAGAAPIRLSAAFFEKHLKAGRLVLADPTHVPAGIYAREALKNMNLWHVVQHRLALGINVRAALALLERREAPLGILYKTDVLTNPHTKIVSTFPPSSHAPIEYTAALAIGRTGKEVLKFFQYLQSPVAEARLSQFGFDPV